MSYPPGWCPPLPPPYHGPSAADLAFHFIRERRRETGESCEEASRFVRRQYPQLFPADSPWGK